jgi:enamine deaminase RidA (YjgF/YER057c/UK114 family)
MWCLLTVKRVLLASYPDFGVGLRDLVGDYDIAMTAVEVAALIEDRAKIEVEVTAVVGD